MCENWDTAKLQWFFIKQKHPTVNLFKKFLANRKVFKCYFEVLGIRLATYKNCGK